ncbi:MAG: DNA polymerase III subunit chi [Geminicoccaceae bacterium]|nr:DNA polymerase III subunit chi [Geminicoccaceae bacterium]MCS7267108.1 DNA polymerase III subunit chi [Geminicoccaceae bacterium]MCX7630030.1 DNA polymerase III subunit chi [Geminicoccaceae bacterium]MDW8124978.1 DNA polymerase III subunit chi [Geminicoccaceae bacterium]MDW8341720.1 DNA polymerase III subunit chi [Geminicoccaceae bacterium]
MSEIGFYHLTRSSLEQALARLLEKVLESGQRAVVRVADEARLEALDRALWTYEQGSFLPHGTAADGFADQQPIWLTTGIDRPNGARVLVLVGDAAEEGLEAYERVIVPFEGADESAVARARERWRRWRAQGHRLVYWQQDERGRWVRAREA